MSNPYAPPSPDRAPDDDAGARPPVPPHPHPPQHPHPYPPRPQPPQPGPEPTPPDPEALARVGRLTRHFSVWLVAGVVISLLPTPWRLATVPFLVGAGIAGVRALHAAGTARLRGGLLPLLTAGLVMTGILLVGSFGSVATLRLDLDRQACLSSALTRSASAECERAWTEGLENLSGGLLGGDDAAP